MGAAGDAVDDAVTRAVAHVLAGAGDAVFVGFSGGRDSTVLLHAAAALRPERVTAVHVNHGLDRQAGSWERHCAATAERLGVGYLARRVTVAASGSLEAAARHARYLVFERLLATPGSLLLLAHHRLDQSETVLLRLLQGRGLYGMPARRPLGSGTLLRPLLAVEPQCLADYARRHALSWIEDPSNANERLDRNFLRHRVLPALRGRWPGVDTALLNAMAGYRLAEAALTGPFGDLRRTGRLALADLADLGAGGSVELVRLWLQAHGLAPPPRQALAELLRQLHTAGVDRQPRLGVGSSSLRRYREYLYLVGPPPVLASGYHVAMPGFTALPHGSLEVVRDPAGFRADGEVEVRFRRGGERLRTTAGHRPLKALLRDAGVPPWLRSRYPLLFDAAGLLAVPGVAARHSDGPGTGPGWRAIWHAMAA